MPTAKTAPKKAVATPVSLLIGTKKGAFILKSNRERSAWKVSEPLMLGSSVHHMVLDPRDGKTLLMAAVTGHLGPTVFRSTDSGKSWKEAQQPPAFKKAADGQGKVVKHTFWLTPGHSSEPNVWYAGTSPQGLFRSEDGGATWQGLASFNDDPSWESWTGGAQDGTPDGPKMHSILIDPRDKKHMYICMSSGGVHETTDQGRTWKPLNKGLKHAFIEDPATWELAPNHDPHRVQMHPAQPDRLYMQAHTGIFRIDRPSNEWKQIGKSMPKEVGDIGFPIVVHPRDAKTAWVFPMDGGTVWPRTSPGGKPAVFATNDSGKTWQRQATGLPKSNAYWTVLRQAMTNDARNPIGLYFGTTTGQVWGSKNEGKSWAVIGENLPHIYSLETANLR